MAYRQYIGARYVPKFDGVWNSTKNYEPLTVVEDGNGNSYTSMKDVPAGTPLSDRNFWILTASFSGAIEQLRRDLQAAQQEIDDIQGEVDAAETAINDINEWIDHQTEQKCALFVGDSYAVGTGYNATLADLLGYDANHRAIFDASGYGFAGANPGVTNGKWLTYIQNNLSRITFDYADVELIVVSGGLNDTYAASESQITTAIAEFMTYCKSKFPNAIVKIAMIGVNMGIAGSAGWQRYTDVYAKVIPAYKKCILYGAEYLNGCEWIMYNRARLQTDAWNHPVYNDDNRIWIASHLAAAVNLGEIEVVETCPIAFMKNGDFDVPVYTISGMLERRGGRFTIRNTATYTGTVQQMETVERTWSANSSLTAVKCLISGDLSVLPPLTHSAVQVGIHSATINIFQNAAGTTKTILAGYIKVNTDDVSKLAITVATAPNGQMAGTYTAGYGIVTPIIFEFWKP